MSTPKYKKLAREKQMKNEAAIARYKKQLESSKKSSKKEFVEYAPTQPFVRDTPHYPSLKTSDTVPGACAKKESQKYTGDLIVGIGTMHKSNAVPIMRGTKQAEEIAQMRRN